jgi:hypothetical protein
VAAETGAATEEVAAGTKTAHAGVGSPPSIGGTVPVTFRGSAWMNTIAALEQEIRKLERQAQTAERRSAKTADAHEQRTNRRLARELRSTAEALRSIIDRIRKISKQQRDRGEH